MADRPILYSAAMIRAHRENRKAQTRRIIKPQPAPCSHKPWPGVHDEPNWVIEGVEMHCAQCGNGMRLARNPSGVTGINLRFAKGDRLWVRETISFEHRWTGTKPSDVPKGEPVWYWADGNPTDGDWTKPIVSIHMPRWCSRITDTVTDVRVQRLQDISEADAIAEGAREHFDIPVATWPAYSKPNRWSMEDAPPNTDHCLSTARWAFANYWAKLNGEENWNANPWVVALTFEIAHRNIDSAPMPEREERT